MADKMEFPATFKEFAEQYKIVDKKEVYTNGTELIPIFRVEQWLDNADVAPKREVAKEIFEEIKKIITVIDEIVYDGKVIFSDKKNGLWHPISPSAFAKLEKKYLGEEIDIPTEVDCLGRRPKFRKEWHKANNTLVREIFEEIDGITDLVAKGLIGELEFYDKIAELKKKYTESEDKI